MSTAFLSLWVWRFLRHHKIGVVGGCFLGSGCAAFVDAVWCACFCATCCMESVACGCETMYRLLFHHLPTK
jgi:hypothetical protein